MARLRPWMLVAAGWMAPAALATISAVAQRRLHGEPPASVQDLIFAGGDWLIYGFLTPPIFWAVGRWPIVRPRIARHALLHVGISLLFCVAWAVCGKLLQLTLGMIFDPDAVRTMVTEAGDRFWWMLVSDWLSWVFTTLPFGVVVYLCVAGMAHAIQYFVEAREREVQMARLNEQLTGARLAALHARINPHFLFNSLNTIAVLVRDGDKATATRVIEQLSDVLRTTLARTANEVALEDELELVGHYLAVEQARFSDRLRPQIDVGPEAVAARVPAFALQHLVENAIRHGIARRTDAGRIVVRAHRQGDALQISVEDDGAGLSGETALPGHGLENTRERLRTLYGDRASLTVSASGERGTIARLSMPFREAVLEPEHDSQPNQER